MRKTQLISDAQMIGRLKMEVDWLQKKLGDGAEELPLSRQCELAEVPRATVYRRRAAKAPQEAGAAAPSIIRRAAAFTTVKRNTILACTSFASTTASDCIRVADKLDPTERGRLLDDAARATVTPVAADGLHVENDRGQGVDPYSGRTLDPSRAHFPLD